MQTMLKSITTRFAVRSMRLATALLLGVAPCSVESSELPWWVSDVRVTLPDGSGLGAVTLSGDWIDTCVPDAIGHSLSAGTLTLEVTVPNLEVGCGDAITPWSLTEEFGPVDQLPLTVEGIITAVSPLNRNVRDPLSGPDRLAHIAPPPNLSFHGLDSMPPDAYLSRSFDTSANGRVVVGHNHLAPWAFGLIASEAFAWTPTTRMFPLGILPGGIPGGSTALGISGDGNTIVGVSTADLGWERAFIWTLGDGMRELPSATSPVMSRATAASWNGSVVVGTETFAGPTPGGVTESNAFRWTRQSGSVYLGELYRGGSSFGHDVSADGRVVVGSAKPSFFTFDQHEDVTLQDIAQAFVWTEETGMTGIGHLDSMRIDTAAIPSVWESSALAVSAHGEYVVGTSKEYLGLPDRQFLLGRGFVWSRAAGMVDLGEVPGVSARDIEARDISADGRLIVGMAERLPSDDTTSPPDRLPILWERGRGWRRLDEVVTALGGSELIAGWQLGEVSSISADGTTLVGTGINPNGISEAWRLVFDWPAVAAAAHLGDLNGDGIIDAADAAIMLGQWGSDDANADLTADGVVDAADAAIMFEYWTRHLDLEARHPVVATERVQFIPEPTGGGWLAWTLLLAIRRRRPVPAFTSAQANTSS